MNVKAIGAIALTLMIAVPIGLGYMLSVEEEETTGYETTTQSNISNMLLNHSKNYTGAYTGPSNNSVIYQAYSSPSTGEGFEGFESVDYVTSGTTATSNPLYTPETVSLSISSNTWTDVTGYGYFNINASVKVRLTYSDGTTQILPLCSIVAHSPEGLTYIQSANPSVQKTYPGVTSIEITTVNSPASETISLVKSTPSSTTYGVASDGWRLPYPYWCKWTNGQDNESVTMYIEFGAGLTRASIFNNGLNLTRSSSGVVTCNWNYGTDITLGEYSCLQVILTKTEATISGLTAWPTMGATPTQLNTIKISYAEQDLNLIRLSGSASVLFRVDQTAAVAGSFPDTLDYALDLTSLYPDSMLSLKLNSIGIYGDTLQIGSDSYAVTDGRITVDGKKVSLKGALISFLPNEDDELVGSINGRELGTFDELPTITFGGEWSLTAIAYKVEEVSTTNMTWNAGGFGLDKEGFAAAGLITAGAVFVALGMQGRASGTKIGLLLLICGGAAFAYFSFL